MGGVFFIDTSQFEAGFRRTSRANLPVVTDGRCDRACTSFRPLQREAVRLKYIIYVLIYLLKAYSRPSIAVIAGILSALNITQVNALTQRATPVWAEQY